MIGRPPGRIAGREVTPMLRLRPPSLLERALSTTRSGALVGLAWILVTSAWVVVSSPLLALVGDGRSAPAPGALWLVPTLALCALLARAWRRSAAARRALEAHAVTTLSGHRLLPARQVGEPVRILVAQRLDLGQAAREYAAQVHVSRGDRESLDLGACERSADAPTRFTLAFSTALGGREELVFDCAPLLAATGARFARRA